MNETEAISLGRDLSVKIKHKATAYTNGAWTQAVYLCLQDFSRTKGWNIHPKEKCYKGEYHCDFTIFEEGYGCRLACESQWETSRGTIEGEIEWAFEKLRGVKADVKLLIFESSIDDWQSPIKNYLTGYAQLDLTETFIFLRWHKDRFERFSWKPANLGVQTESLLFEGF